MGVFISRSYLKQR